MLREGDLVFTALADPSRRLLLDRLQARDGQTLAELQGHLPMTRFGVMKHLRVLEDAGLVVTRKVGREKFHYLNAVPIQQMYERWVSKYAESWSGVLTALKTTLEQQMTPDHVFEIIIKTTPDRLWQALTDGDLTELYYFQSRVQSDWRVGSSYSFPNPGGGTFVEGEVLEVDPPRKLVQSFRATFNPEWADEPASRVTWEILPLGDSCKLTLTHSGLQPGAMAAGLHDGWVLIISGLKTYLETGQSMGAAPMAAAAV